MLSNKQIICPNNLLDASIKKKGASAAIVNAGKPLPMQSVMDAVKEDLIKPIFIGDKEQIQKCANEIQFDISGYEVIHEPVENNTAAVAAKLAMQGKVKIIVKGHIHTDILMKEVLKREYKLLGKTRLSHVWHMTLEKDDKPLIITDGALNVLPNVKTKMHILKNVIDFSKRIGNNRPKIAVLSATEEVLDSIQSSMEAKEITELAKKENLDADVFGPLVFARDDDVIEAGSYAESISRHAEMHYAIFASGSLPQVPTGSSPKKISDLSLGELFHYHTYGDYRLVAERLPSGKVINILRYRGLRSSGDRTAFTRVKNENEMVQLLTRYANEEEPDLLKGVYSGDGNQMKASNTEWFSSQLTDSDEAKKFHLPSLGTLPLLTLSHRNTIDKIINALKQSLSNLAEAFTDPRFNKPDFIRNDYDEHDGDETAVNTQLFDLLGKVMENHPEINQLFTDFPVESAILKETREIIDGIYKKDSIDDAINTFVNTIKKTNLTHIYPIKAAVKWKDDDRVWETTDCSREAVALLVDLKLIDMGYKINSLWMKNTYIIC